MTLFWKFPNLNRETDRDFWKALLKTGFGNAKQRAWKDCVEEINRLIELSICGGISIFMPMY